MAIFSSLKKVDASCVEYVHHYDPSCTSAALHLTYDSAMESLRVYSMAYLFALLMRGKIPSKEDLKRTVIGILQSSVFLTVNGNMYSVSLCTLRYLMGGFNVLTASFIPSFISSMIAIMIERPSRRSLLCLYVTNVASETLFRMAVWRGWVTPIRHGEVLIFAASIAQLLYLYKKDTSVKDPIFGFLRFLVGPTEEAGWSRPESVITDPGEGPSNIGQMPQEIEPHPSGSGHQPLAAYASLRQWIRSRLKSIQNLPSHPSCRHSHSCLSYVLKDGGRLFLLGYSIQMGLKFFLQFRRILRRPSVMSSIVFSIDTMRLGGLFAGFNVLFKGLVCSGRWTLGKDDPRLAIPAGLIAGLAFALYKDNTIALYFFWKGLHMWWKRAEAKGKVQSVPWATEIIYSLATATLFHSALIEPLTLRPSYWRFLMGISGKRVKLMNRKCVDDFGYETSRHLAAVLAHPNNN